jgi:hypothetical protein
MRTQPLPATQTGWLPVPVRVRPLDNSTSYTAACWAVMPASSTGFHPCRVSTMSPACTVSMGRSPTEVRTAVPATKQEWSFSLMGLSSPRSAAASSHE